MSSFDFYERRNTTTGERFPINSDIRGMEEWQAFTREPSYFFLNQIRKLGAPPLKCPRVFVSHRQADEDFALRIAYLATTKKFDFWLDVFDPFLQAIPYLDIYTDDQKLLLTAGIIEMALINCTHVIAVLTSNTVGTMWVPYEYGRIADLPTYYGRACTWKHPIQKFYSPEYLLLGIETNDEPGIQNWLEAEMRMWEGENRCSCLKVEWDKKKPIPGKLP